MLNRILMLTTLSASLATGLAATGCKTDDAAGGDDVTAAEQASTSVESSAEATYLSAYFAGAASLTIRDVPTADAQVAVLAALQTHLVADLADASCSTVDTDGATYLAVTFAGCTGAHGHLSMSGTVRAELGFETAPCGQLACPVAVLYDVSTTDLQINQTTFSGAWQVRDPLAAGQPYTWTGGLDVTSPRRSVSTSTVATFTRSSADDCVDVSFDTTIEGSGGRSLAISAEGVHRCMGACPSAGLVSVTGETGATWSWSYDGEGGATVTGAAGETFDVELACAQ